MLVESPRQNYSEMIVDEKLSYEYQGYTIALNPDNGQWQVLWQEQVQAVNFNSAGEAEQWIDDLLPLNR